MDLRFALDLPYSRASNNGINGTAGSSSAAETLFGISRPFYFCPVVDELQAFKLNQSARLVALNRDGVTFSNYPRTANLTVIGMQYKTNPSIIPELWQDSTVTVYEANSSACGGTGAAVATFLVLNITVNQGVYTYGSGAEAQPIGAGFTPTCVDDNCLTNPSAVCIGPKGRKNCATCYSRPSDVGATDSLTIWASYYGTDSNGRVMTSGGSNPLAFTQFSATPIFKSVSDEISKIGHDF